MQMLDILISAGVPKAASELSWLFDAARVADVPMQLFSQAANFEEFHSDMLVKICNRGKWPSKDTFEKVDIQMVPFRGIISLTETKDYSIIKRTHTGRDDLKKLCSMLGAQFVMLPCRLLGVV